MRSVGWPAAVGREQAKTRPGLRAVPPSLSSRFDTDLLRQLAQSRQQFFVACQLAAPHLAHLQRLELNYPKGITLSLVFLLREARALKKVNGRHI